MYNVRANKETGLVHLWLSNDDASNEGCRALATDIRKPGQVAEAMQATVEDANPLLERSNAHGLFLDLLTTALGHVEWREVANASFEAARE
jgi:hypothetical protein